MSPCRSNQKSSLSPELYNSFINGVESLHIVGTYERGDVEEEGEVYEVVNIKTLKQVSNTESYLLGF